MELITEELIEMHDRHRTGKLTPADRERLQTMMMNPGTKAAWDELERIAGSYQSVPAGELPKDFTGNVMASIRALKAAKAKASDAKPLAVQAKRWPVFVWAPASAALGAVILALAQMIFPEARVVTGSSLPVDWVCRPAYAVVGSEGHRLDHVRHQLPAEFHITATEQPQDILLQAPGAQICGTGMGDLCDRWHPFDPVKIAYHCVKQ